MTSTSSQQEVGIAAVTAHIPPGYLDNAERAPALEASPELLHDKIGVRRVSRKTPDEQASDLGIHAIEKLFEQDAVRPEEIDCLVVVTQNPDGYGLPHTSARIHGRLGLPRNCAVFDMSLGCSGYVYGLAMMQGFMQGQGFKRGLLVTSDPYSRIINLADRNTSLLFGDAAAATLLTDQPAWHIGRFDLGSDGSICEELAVVDETRQLYMNGRAVLNFSAKQVPDSIRRALALNELTLDDVDLFLLHQGSRHIVRTIAKRLEIDESRAPFLAADYGNTVSSSLPLMLTEPSVQSARTLLLSGFGVGLSWGSTVLTRAD